jgi:2,5-diketo-D-gluconate reductase B
MDDSLKKLKTDYVDLLLLHWPSSAVSLEEQIRGLNAIANAGKARHIGMSNFNTALMKTSAILSEKPLVTNQVEYHPYMDQTPVLTTARELGMSVTAYYAMTDGKVLQDETIRAIAATHNKGAAQIVLRWLVQQEGVIALSKTVSEERARQNFKIFDFKLSEGRDALNS